MNPPDCIQTWSRNVRGSVEQWNLVDFLQALRKKEFKGETPDDVMVCAAHLLGAAADLHIYD